MSRSDTITTLLDEIEEIRASLAPHSHQIEAIPFIISRADALLERHRPQYPKKEKANVRPVR